MGARFRIGTKASIPIGWVGQRRRKRSEDDAARRLMRAIESVTANPALHTGDLGGQAKTTDVTAAVIAALRHAA